MTFLHYPDDYLTFNVSLSIYRKRKNIDSDMEEKRLTGKNLFTSYVFAKNAFDTLYKELSQEHKIVICATNDKRAKAYESFLKKYGFEKKYIHYKGISNFMFVKDNR